MLLLLKLTLWGVHCRARSRHALVLDNLVIVLNEAHLRRLLGEFFEYYHKDRTHLSLGKDPPSGRTVCPPSSPTASVTSVPRIGGLHHRYEWREAA